MRVIDGGAARNHGTLAMEKCRAGARAPNETCLGSSFHSEVDSSLLLELLELSSGILGHEQGLLQGGARLEIWGQAFGRPNN